MRIVDGSLVSAALSLVRIEEANWSRVCQACAFRAKMLRRLLFRVLGTPQCMVEFLRAFLSRSTVSECVSLKVASAFMCL